jgi:LacI family transcriptional regulator
MATIADAAGVSIPTVSKVLNGRADVAAPTRSRVESVVSEFGYQRPRPRRPRRSGLIDLVFHDLSPWAIEVIRGAEHAALAANSRVAVTVASDAAETGRWLASLAVGRTDGVILVLTDLSPAHRKRLAALRTPIVIIDPVGQPEPGIPSIGAANWSGGLAATEHLIGLGHRKIGTITGRPDVLCSQQRLDGYRAALERAGLQVDPSLITYGDFRYDNARASATALLSLPDPPTAIFAASDVQAMGVYEAARERHLRIPDDLSVVGFDDVPMAQWMAPPLTTLRQPLREMAALAVRTLLSGDADSYNQRMELATNLIIRSSTALRSVRVGHGRRLRREAGTAAR